MNHVSISAINMVKVDQCQIPKKFSKELRRADDFTKLIVTCTDSAINVARHRPTPAPQSIGLFLGTSLGPLETSFRFLDTLLDNGEGQASPTLFSHSVHNTATGYLARIFKIYGPSVTITSFIWPFLTALQQAVMAISTNVISRALVVTGETSSPVINDALNNFNYDSYNENTLGAITWILDKSEPNNSQNNLKINQINLAENKCHASTFLTRKNETLIFDGHEKISLTGRETYAFSISKFLQNRLINPETEETSCIIEAPFGRAALHLSL